MTKKRWQIDPNLSAQENLWDAAKVACIYILLHSKIHDKKRDWDELLDALIYRGVRYFYLRLNRHEYDKSHSFYENVFSCCYSASSHEIKQRVKHNQESVKFVSTSTEVDADHTLGDILVDPGRPVLFDPPKHELDKKILDDTAKERFSITRYTYEPLKSFEAAWKLEDEDAAMLGLEIPEEAMQRRDEIRRRIAELPHPDQQILKKRKWMRDYYRRRREEQKKNGV